MDEMNGYKLSRQWFDFCFDNPEKIRPIHTAIYFFAVEHCNRLGWKEKFGFPTNMAMEAIGIKNWRTYNNAFTDIVDWGFVKLIRKSKNQHSSCVISLCKKYNGTVEASTKSLDKALLKHAQKQSSNTVGIDKQLNNEQENNKPINHVFDDFWDSYGKKVGSKKKAEKKWNDLTDSERDFIMEHIDSYVDSFDDKQYQPYPTTFLNGKNWESEEFSKKESNKVKIDMRRFH